MSLCSTPSCFPIFSPSPPLEPTRTPARTHFPSPPEPARTLTLTHLSRWNNANAQRFIRHERSQQELEALLRQSKKDQLAENLSDVPFDGNPNDPNPIFRSSGTPSSPSRPSIPGKKSKYSRPEKLRRYAGKRGRSYSGVGPIRVSGEFYGFSGGSETLEKDDNSSVINGDIQNAEFLAIKVSDSSETFENNEFPAIRVSEDSETPENHEISLENGDSFDCDLQNTEFPSIRALEDSKTLEIHKLSSENVPANEISNPRKDTRSSSSKKDPQHPAFRPIRAYKPLRSHGSFSRNSEKSETGFSVGEHGVSYKLVNAPFEFQYSYTETPKVKPLALREPPFMPFGPSTMPRPWTGRAPLPPSKKKLPEFDSFKLPPPHKKGVKPVQAPGPYLPGTGPRYVKSREEILGEPLTTEEVNSLIRTCLKSKRQLNMGRDGLTHNMLDNIHAHWKRLRACKIKCKGVCTVDMDNVCEQLEEKTGGKIIYRRGGVLYLFRGRNYNYRLRPRFPLMLWRPITPVYPRLIPLVPEGLTLEEAKEMRKKGRKVPPICKLAKNGVYVDLVKNVKEAFEECELVRINCQGLNASDYKKIGAKLKDIVPCVLISFENEHILMWRGRDWTSSPSKLENDSETLEIAEVSSETGAPDPQILPISNPDTSSSALDTEKCSTTSSQPNQVDSNCIEPNNISMLKVSNNMLTEETEVGPTPTFQDALAISSECGANCSEITPESSGSCIDPLVLLESSRSNSQPVLEDSRSEVEVKLNGSESETLASFEGSRSISELSVTPKGLGSKMVVSMEGSESKTQLDQEGSKGNLMVVLNASGSNDSGTVLKLREAPGTVSEDSERKGRMAVLGVLRLRERAVVEGMAVVLDEKSYIDANIVYDRAVKLALTAPKDPVFVHNRHNKREVLVNKGKERGSELRGRENVGVVQVKAKESSERKVKEGSERKKSSVKVQKRREVHFDAIPHGNLAVDELAKLLG
ncbi:hypothetical protein AMTRI_Chr05g57720 [Amborella trichopoda]|uniref:CRM domain-containing protein n=1 Tax=Amborella trichopoda TaxID=13333 RepID=U5CPJ4_AMBTC|nr:CRS2-associated factor 1, chloroplastic [Amborella trichopoda]ERN15076.1 hypothetical protein AMTR_s00056p00043140 [Amborella trichopoda]|eukprot:XP_006853609.1 CRS2-associated factor 1, chloroplastic [Amborella trichopoda]